MQQTNFWAQDMDEAARQSMQAYPETAQQTTQLANEICQQQFTFRGHWEMERTHQPVVFTGKIDWATPPGDDPEWVYAFNRLTSFVTLGKAWRYTGDEKYVAAFVRQAQSWLQNVPYTPESTKTTWRSIETGLRCKNWLQAVSLMQNSPLVTPELLAKIKASLTQHAQWLLEANREFQRLSNWGVLQNHGLFLLGLSLNNKEWAQIAASRLEQELFYQVLADGTHWEQSPLYHCEVLHCCLDTMLAARRAGFVLPQAFLQRTHAMATALASMLRPDGLLVCQSDSDEVDARDLLALAALLFADKNLKAIAGPRLLEENIWSFGDLAPEYLMLSTGERLASTALPASGNYMLRGTTTPESDFLHMHCGSLGSGHGHADLLHVDLISNGETILADSGRYTYVDSPLRKQFKSPAGHNTILVDKQDFSVYKDSWGYSKLAQPLKGEYHYTPEADYISGTHLGYSQNGVLPRRQVLRLGTNLWVLWDTLIPFDEQQHSYQHLFHFGADGTAALQPGEQRAVYTGQKAAANLLFCGEGVQLLQSEAPLSREYNKLETGSLITASHSAKGFAQLVTVITTGKAGSLPQLTAQLLPVQLLAAQKQLPAQTAKALKITCNGQSWLVIICHNEVIAEVDMLAAEGYYGYGQVMVFTPQNPRGICLAW
ncbi:heparinase II/III family protein [Ruminococcaceae bacterium OttesenSCG-928-A16]|nr:heparinase II/III family protein [Ruminococcaceae bacterium OttesenSCG-928-A16]